MFTPMDFEDYFIKFLEKEIASKFKLKGYNEKTKKEIYKNPKVIKGFILPKFNGASEFTELPFILFRMNGLEAIKQDGYKAKINQKNLHCLRTSILFECYCSGKENLNDGSGYRDLWNIMEKTRQALFNGTYKPKVNLFEDTFSMQIHEEQYYPIWIGQINADFIFDIPDWN